MKFFVLYFTILLIGVLTSAGVNSQRFTCPADDDIGCIECECDPQTGYSECKPHSCPSHVETVASAKVAPKEGDCRFGKTFKAQCMSCDCTGSRDHCQMCAAVPVKRPEQTAEVNDILPWINDQRFFNYEVNGWKKPLNM